MIHVSFQKRILHIHLLGHFSLRSFSLFTPHKWALSHRTPCMAVVFISSNLSPTINFTCFVTVNLPSERSLVFDTRSFCYLYLIQRHRSYRKGQPVYHLLPCIWYRDVSASRRYRSAPSVSLLFNTYLSLSCLVSCIFLNWTLSDLTCVQHDTRFFLSPDDNPWVHNTGTP